MYTVCPKCALTLVVTAADLRVAQGFVRCGRCSNVFNALARLSDDRRTAVDGVASATLSQPAPPAPLEESQAPQRPDAESPADTTAAQAAQAAQAEQAEQAEQASAQHEPSREADEVIPETALEFNPEATDVSKGFVEQAPDPQWSAATGKFKALIRKAQSAAQSATQAAARSSAPRAPEGTAQSAPQARPAAHPAPQTAAPAASETATQTALRAAQRTASQKSPQTEPETARHTAPGSAHQPAVSSPSPTTAPQTPASVPADASVPSHEDSQFDVEIDAAFLAATAPLKPQHPVAQTKRPPAAAAPIAPAQSRAPARVVSPTPRASLPEPDRAPVSRPEPAADEAAEFEIESESAPAAARQATPLSHLWSAGTGALAILLVAQIVHHYRHDLATNERLYKPLTALYSALGIPLVPRWNLGAYDVRQLGASADNVTAGQITVRASVKNTAKQAQPLPFLRVTLQDRFGNRIAARDVPPKSYLPSAIPASSFLSAGQRIDAEMGFVDPGSSAVGFEIDACLPAPGGSIACANDAGR